MPIAGLALGLCSTCMRQQVSPDCPAADGTDGQVLGGLVVKPHQNGKIVTCGQSKGECLIWRIGDVA